MKDKILSLAISACTTGALVSGHETVQEFGFYVALAFNLLGWVAVAAISSMDIKAVKKVTSTPVISWAFSIASVCALIYSGHPILAASSLICCSFIYSSCRARIKKEA